LLEEKDYKISLVLVPESYDYNDGEIVYRIFVDGQLISERSLPLLSPNEALCDTFVVKLNKDTHNIFVEELGDKRLLLKKIIINDKIYNILVKSRTIIQTGNVLIVITVEKRNK
jgi:hypothetical protein